MNKINKSLFSSNHNEIEAKYGEDIEQIDEEEAPQSQIIEEKNSENFGTDERN